MVYRVFISHAFDHFALYDSIVSRLNAARFNWLDCSVPRHRRYLPDGKPLADEEMKELLARHIDDCDVVVVIAKPVVSRRPWLQWELEYSRAAGKPVLAVWRRQVDRRVSKFARERADLCVDTWHITSITRAIDMLASAPPRVQEVPSASLIRALPDVSQDAVSDETVVPDVASPPSEPLAPSTELALGLDEVSEGDTPKVALAPTFQRLAEAGVTEPVLMPIYAQPLLKVAEREASPKKVIGAAQSRRRWWQFWKPREHAELRAS